MKKLFLTVITILFVSTFVQAADTQNDNKPILIRSSPITSGAILKEYLWETSNGNVNINVIEVDLNDQFVEIDSILGAGKITKKAKVSEMAFASDAVAAINGDFFNTQSEGAPIGPMVMNGEYVSSAPLLQNLFAFGIDVDKKAYIEQFSFDGMVKAPNGVEFKISGLNKTTYFEEPISVNSFVNKLYLYNDLWGGSKRGGDSNTTPTEILIKDNEVLEISVGKYFDYPVPEGMYILRGHGEAAKFLVNNFSVGDNIEIAYSMTPAIEWEMVVGGHSLLIDEGESIPYARYSSSLDGTRARSAIGISQDQKKVYIVGVERHLPLSVGLRLADLSKFFEELGAWKAVNLDGGGSTTMVSRPLGEFLTTKVLVPEQNTQRAVVNAIGVYSVAPKGSLSGLLVYGEDVVLINEKIDYSLKGYDEFYNPIEVDMPSAIWTEALGLGQFQGNTFTAKSSGNTDIAVSINSAKVNMPVKVLGKSDISKLSLINISDNTKKMQIELISKNLDLKVVPTDIVEWETYRIKGEVSSDGVFDMQDSQASDIGFLIARYQGFSAPLALQFNGQREIVELTDINSVLFDAYPEKVQGSIRIFMDPENTKKRTLKLDYDFTNAQGSTAAYVKFSDSGILVDNLVKEVSISAYGNAGNEWLRAEVEDGNGNIQRIDLSTQIDWVGWQNLKFSTVDLVKPITIKRIYVVVTDDQKSTRSLQGSLLLKELSFIYNDKQIKQNQPKTLELFIGKKTLKVDDIETQMDVAPIILEGRTLVPIRFVSESLGAEVLWNEKTRNVTIIKERDWIDLWPGEDMIIVNGNAIQLDVKPQLIQGRTMIPLRAVAESLDLSVEWDPKTQKITLK